MTDNPTDPTIGKDGKSYPLTAKQMAFVRAYWEPDENGVRRSQADAYRMAYNCKNMADKTIREAASRLLDNSNVIAMLEQLKASAARKSAETIEDAEQEWAELKRMAVDAGQLSAAIAAEANRQKLKGWLKDHIEQRITNVTPADHKPDLSSLRRAAASNAPESPHNHDVAEADQPTTH